MLSGVSFSRLRRRDPGHRGHRRKRQKELLEAIAGLQKAQAGARSAISARVGGAYRRQAFRSNGTGGAGGEEPHPDREKSGVSLAFVPEDRLGMGLVAGMDMVDNMMLKTYKNGRGPLVDRWPPKSWPRT